MAAINTYVKRAADKLTGKEADKAAMSEKLDRYWNSAEGARKEIDWRWFNYDLWVSGNHYAKWDKNTQQITSSTRSDGRPKVVINKVYTTLRSVRSYALQNKPKPNVTPYNMSQETVDEAAKLNKYLMFLHDHLHLGQSLRATMWHALKYSVGYWQILWDDEAEDGQGQIAINVVDPYDLYWDPSARLPKEARFVVLAVRRNLDDLRDDPKYKDADWPNIMGDKLLAASSLKSRLMQYERGENRISNDDKKESTAIVKEFWYKEKDEKTNKIKIMLCTKIGSEIIRGPIDTGLDRFPFFRLSSDIEPLSMYGTGWVKNLIPVNRLLERLESSAAEYNDLVNKGKWIEDRGAGTKIINNEHGQIIQKKRGFEVTAAVIPRIDGSLLFNQITNANRYIEDIGAMHDASLGRIPSGAKSGISIETLMEGDSNNLSELVENTEEFLEDTYEYVLYLTSQKYQFARNIIVTTTTGERDFLKVIGEEANERTPMEGATVIPSKAAVDVKIESWLAYTSDGRRQAVEQLGQLMAQNGYQLPADFILEAFETGNVAEMVSKMMQQKQQDQQNQMQQQQQQAQMQTQQNMQQAQQQAQIQQQQQAAAAPQAAGAQQAIAFIRSLLNGQKPELPEVVGPEFIQYLDKFMQSPEAQQAGGELLSVLQQDRDQAVLHMQKGQAGQTVQ